MKIWGKPAPGLPNITTIGPEIVLTAYHNGAIPAPKPIVRYAPPPTYEQTEEIRSEQAQTKIRTVASAQKKQTAARTTAPAVAKKVVDKTTAVKSIKSSAAKASASQKSVAASSSGFARSIASASMRLVRSASLGGSVSSAPITKVSKPEPPPKVVVQKIKVFDKCAERDITILETEFDGNRHERWPDSWARPKGKWIPIGSAYWPYKSVYVPTGFYLFAPPDIPSLIRIVRDYVKQFGAHEGFYLSQYC